MVIQNYFEGFYYINLLFINLLLLDYFNLIFKKEKSYSTTLKMFSLIVIIIKIVAIGFGKLSNNIGNTSYVKCPSYISNCLIMYFKGIN